MTSVTLMSFSFKQGIPEANAVFDVRFLKNPHYEPDLKQLTGLDAAAGAYIETDEHFAGFFAKLTDFAEWMPGAYEKDITLAVGCTGGRHRSVYVAEKLGAFLRKKGYTLEIIHRDLEIKK